MSTKQPLHEVDAIGSREPYQVVFSGSEESTTLELELTEAQLRFLRFLQTELVSQKEGFLSPEITIRKQQARTIMEWVEI